jgi:hypothetical protein
VGLGDVYKRQSVSTAGCHGTADIHDEHAGVEAPDGDHCGYCHEGAGTEQETRSELRNIIE